MTSLYVGRVCHARFGAKSHRLTYRIYMFCQDLDALGAVSTIGAVFGRLFASDYQSRSQIENLIVENGHPAPGGRIRLLTMPRVLGRAFNPLSVYYCDDRDGGLAMVVYEVRNTFGGRHWYVLPADGQRCEKDFFVSPFMDQDLAYAFDVTAPGETAHIGIRVARAGETVLTASFHGFEKPLTAASLFGAWISHPLQTVGVLAGIYFEGLKLLIRGFRWRSPHAVSV